MGYPCTRISIKHQYYYIRNINKTSKLVKKTQKQGNIENQMNILRINDKRSVFFFKKKRVDQGVMIKKVKIGLYSPSRGPMAALISGYHNTFQVPAHRFTALYPSVVLTLPSTQYLIAYKGKWRRRGREGGRGWGMYFPQPGHLFRNCHWVP